MQVQDSWKHAQPSSEEYGMICGLCTFNYARMYNIWLIQVALAGVHAYGRGRLLFSRFLGQFFRGVLRQTPGKPLATWHQFGTKTWRWSGHFLEWRGARSNGITMG
jgi:hypothetical protein